MLWVSCRRLENKLLDMQMEAKLVQILFDTSSLQGNRTCYERNQEKMNQRITITQHFCHTSTDAGLSLEHFLGGWLLLIPPLVPNKGPFTGPHAMRRGSRRMTMSGPNVISGTTLFALNPCLSAPVPWFCSSVLYLGD